MSNEPTNIHELFQRDPLELTKEDITEIIAKFRADRHTFKQQSLTGGRPKAAPKPTQTSSLDIDISL